MPIPLPLRRAHGLISILSPVKIRRDSAACIDCNKCTHACPSHLPVAQLVTIRSAECTGCQSCIAICPAENALNFAFPPRQTPNVQLAADISPAVQSLAISTIRWHNRALQPRTVVLILAILFFGLITAARITHHWQTNLPRSVYQQLVPHADDYTH